MELTNGQILDKVRKRLAREQGRLVEEVEENRRLMRVSTGEIKALQTAETMRCVGRLEAVNWAQRMIDDIEEDFT